MDFARGCLRRWAAVGSPRFVRLNCTGLVLLATAGAARSQTIGPGAAPGPITIGAGTTQTVVGSTIVSATGNVFNIAGGTLIVDTTAGPSPGPIIIMGGGTSLSAAISLTGPGTLNIPFGATIERTGLGAALLAFSGSSVTANNLTVQSPAGAPTNGLHGILANAGSSITLNGSTFVGTGATQAVGLGVNDGGSLLLTGPTTVTAQGLGATGVYALGAGASLALASGSTFNMNGDQNVGLVVANGAGPLIQVSPGLTVNLNSVPGAAGPASSIGVVAYNGGQVALQNLTVQGTGVGGGVWATSTTPGGALSLVQLTGTNTITLGTSRNFGFNPISAWTTTPAGIGAGQPQFGGVASFSNATGLAASGNARIESTRTTINVPVDSTPGQPAAGAHAAGGSIDLTANVINATGANSIGLRLDSITIGGVQFNPVITARDTRITVSGGGEAIRINSAVGTVDLTDTTVLASGAGTEGLLALNFASAGTNLLRMSGGSLVSTDWIALRGQGPLDVNVTNGALVQGGQALVVAEDQAAPQATALRLTASGNSILMGDAYGAPTSGTLDISLLTGSTWTGIASPARPVTNVSVDPTSTWNVTGNSVVSRDTTNAGLIQFTPPAGDPSLLASYKTLTTQNYVGAGGRIGLHTFLGTDGSPSDRLVINGGVASGSSALLVANNTGPGDLTYGNGILVVEAQNGGTTVPGTFTLGRPVVAGPYEYSLYRGSFDASGPENWYLRSVLVPTPPGPDPGPQPVPSPIPDYRREVSLYAALPAMGLIYGRTLIDSLHERVGELRPLEAAPVTEERTIWCKNPEKNFRCTTVVRLPDSVVAANRSYASAGWARIIGTHGDHDGGPGGIFRNGPNFDYDLYGLQAGLDLYRGFNADGSRDHAGVYAAIGRIQGDVRHFNGINAGTNTIDGYSLGAYWTHFGLSGWYLDGVVQGTWFDAEADSKRLLQKLKREGFGFAASLEGGYPIALGNGWTIEPQAQIIYQTLVNGSGSDGAVLVRFSDVESLAGRIGARLAKGWALEDGARPRMLTAWLKASLWNEFLGDPKTSFSSATGFIPFRSDLGGAWAEMRAGIDTQIARNTAIYASAGYSIGFDGRSHAYDGRIGVKVTW